MKVVSSLLVEASALWPAATNALGPESVGLEDGTERRPRSSAAMACPVSDRGDGEVI